MRPLQLSDGAQFGNPRIVILTGRFRVAYEDKSSVSGLLNVEGPSHRGRVAGGVQQVVGPLNVPVRVHFYNCPARFQVLSWAAELGLAGEDGAPVRSRLDNVQRGALRTVSIAVLRLRLYC